MKIQSSIFLAGLLSFGVVQAAQAETKLRGEVYCFPAKDVRNIIDNLNGIEDSRRDIVDVANINEKSRFLIKDNGGWPERFFLRTEVGEFDVPIEKPSGKTPTFLETTLAHAHGDICISDKSRIGRPENKEGLYFEMGLSPLFHNQSGQHDMAELVKGTNDARKFYKQIIPAAVRIFMPETKHLAVRYDDRRSTSQVFALVNGKEVKLEPVFYNEMHIVSFKTLEDLGASAFIIKGGAYKLQPTVSIKVMKRFGWGDDTYETTAAN